jgi:phenylacetate-CoA ligase
MNVRGSLFEAIQRYRTNQFRYLDRLRKWESLNEEQAERLQEKRLEELLRHAHKNTDHYGTLLEKYDVVDDHGVSLRNFCDLPVLNKKTIRNSPDALISTDIDGREWYRNTSGGSTGEPVEFIQDADVRDWKHAVKMLYNEWTGYHAGQPRVRLWGSERDILAGNKTIKNRIGNFLMNEHWENTFKMDETDMRDAVRTINDVRPVQVLGYAESTYQLSKFIRERDLNVHSPDAVMTSAGKLYDEMRQTIRDIFGAPVFDRYGSREVGDMACECKRHDSLHVSLPTHFIEILDEDGRPASPGEPGEIVVTHLTNYAMPLIRYRIGDVAVWAQESCDCGRAWPVLKEIKGRVSDTFVTGDGSRVHGEYFTHLFYHRDWVERFKVIQERKYLIRIEIVESSPSPTDELDEIEQKCQAVMGEQCDIVFDIVNEIERSDSGKFRYTVSEVVS